MCSPASSATAYWAATPSSLRWPMVVLATLATIIASQALITGTFSIVKQVCGCRGQGGGWEVVAPPGR